MRLLASRQLLGTRLSRTAAEAVALRSWTSHRKFRCRMPKFSNRPGVAFNPARDWGLTDGSSELDTTFFSILSLTSFLPHGSLPG
jgi:hypothetical protein